MNLNLPGRVDGVNATRCRRGAVVGPSEVYASRASRVATPSLDAGRRAGDVLLHPSRSEGSACSSSRRSTLEYR